jgi:hypothetical protein
MTAAERDRAESLHRAHSNHKQGRSHDVVNYFLQRSGKRNKGYIKAATKLNEIATPEEIKKRTLERIAQRKRDKRWKDPNKPNAKDFKAKEYWAKKKKEGWRIDEISKEKLRKYIHKADDDVEMRVMVNRGNTRSDPNNIKKIYKRSKWINKARDKFNKKESLHEMDPINKFLLTGFAATTAAGVGATLLKNWLQKRADKKAVLRHEKKQAKLKQKYVK